MTNFIKVVAKLMATDYMEEKVDPKGKDFDEKYKRKSVTGTFPVLQLADERQTCLYEPLSIAKYLAADKYGFYGPNLADKALVDQWIDIISLTIAPKAKNLSNQVCGFMESEIKAFSQECGQFKKSLDLIEKHLKLRNYLVGYQMTLADVYLVATLLSPFQLFVDKKTRDASLPNITRFMNLILNTYYFALTFGNVHFCNKQIMPNFDLKIEKPKVAPAAPAAAKKDDGKKPEKEKKADVKKVEKEKKPDQGKVEKKEEPKPESSKFDLYNFKTLFINHKDQKGEGMAKFYEMLDWENWSFWRLRYDIYANEGDKLHICNNLMNGFLTRAQHTNKYTFGRHCVLGEEGSLQIQGVWLIFGQTIPDALAKDHPQFEYYQTRKLDPKNKADDDKLVREYFCGAAKDIIDGLVCQTITWQK